MEQYLEKIKKYKWHIVAAVIAVFAGLFFAKKKSIAANAEIEHSENKKSGPKKLVISEEVLKKHPLEFLQVKERGLQEEIVLPGKVSYDLEKFAQVGSNVTGRISKVYAKEGGVVHKGSPLASVSSVEFSNVKSDYLKAKAKLDAVKIQAERAKDLFDRKIISAKEFEMANMEYRTVKTEVNTNYNKFLLFGLSKSEIKAIDNSTDNSQDLTIRSPISGTITDRRAIQGDYITPNDNLFEVTDLSNLWILLDVYEKDLYSVKIGAEALVYTLGKKPEMVKAKVAYVGDVIDPIKHTAEIRLEVKNTDYKLKPGQTVSAEVMGLVSSSKSKKMMFLPSEAIHTIEGKTFVFVADVDGTFMAKEVEVGETIDDDVEIKSGLLTNEQVVGKGSFLLKSEYLK
ncbi:MAG: efflux RND transporter periplasmic adaptor subunit [Leptospiraceae bacterium]|nr:efflux RND transporter periplasmic adaptor subunit [Leptospiraceae bacterium]